MVPQEMLENLRKSSNEINLKEEKILNKIEENKNAIENFYNKKIDELNNFNPPFKDENGNNIKFDSKSVTGDKYQYLKMYYSEYDANYPVTNSKSRTQPRSVEFENQLKSEEAKVEKSNESLKIMAESILKYKVALVDKNKEILQDLKSERDSSVQRKNALEGEVKTLEEQIKEIEEKNNILMGEYTNIEDELTSLNDKLNDLKDAQKDLLSRINDKNDELDKAKNDGKTQDEIDLIQKDLDALNGEYSSNINQISEISNNKISSLETKKKENEKITYDNNQKCSDLQSIINLKQNEILTIPDIITYNNIINEMEQICEKLDSSLEKNVEDFTDKFEEVGIDFEIEQKDNGGEENSSKENEQKNNDNTKSSPAAQTQASSNGNIVDQLENNAIVPAANFDLSKFRVDNFINASFDEQKKLLDYYGYAQLADSVSNIGPFQRRKLSNILKSHLESSIPDENDFKDVVNKIPASLGINADELYKALIDSNNTPIAFNKIDKQSLKNINEIVSHFNQNRDNYSETEIKEFEKNFMQFVKKGALLQKSKTGRIANMFSGLTRKSSEFTSLINSISSYTDRSGEKYENKELLRQSLRNSVNTDSHSLDNINLDAPKKKPQEYQR